MKTPASPDPNPLTAVRVSHNTLLGRWRELPSKRRLRLSWGLAFGIVLTLAFIQPLFSLMVYAWNTEIHSHIILIPFLSAYLISIRDPRPSADYRASPAWAALAAAGGLGALAAVWFLREGPQALSLNDRHTLFALSYIGLLMAGGFLFLGRKWMKEAAFPVALLLLLAPLPDAAVHHLEMASQKASAEAAAWFFSLAGIPFLRDGFVFQLDGITLRVAEECSGIRSSLVLFITGLIASHLFLKSSWRRLIFIIMIIPLGIMRNGFRILVIGWLCVEIGPHMIHSIIHRRGGPFFFVLSLIPLFLLLWWLRRGENSGDKADSSPPAIQPAPAQEAMP